MISEIQKLKIALTSDCTLRCTHCNIDKESKLTISKEAAFKGVELLLNSKGGYKRLELYGGEPFLKFYLLKEIVDYALKKANFYKKNISIHIATNGTFINDEILKWIREKRVFIAVSYSGSKDSHNLNRKFKNKSGSYEIVKSNIKKILNAIGSNRFIAIYCVHPKFANNLLEDFKKIISIGVKIIDIECVQGIIWKEKDYVDFEFNFKRINQEIIKLAKKNDFIFHEGFIEFLRNKKFEAPNCPAYMDMEIYPDGKIGFYPYAFVDYEKYKDDIAIGDLDKGIISKYKNCIYGSNLCDECIYDYYKIKGVSEGYRAYNIRNELLRLNFKQILAKDELYTKKYLVKLAKIMNFFYGSI